MSSERKDARWGLALNRINRIGADFSDFTYHGFQKQLDIAEAQLETSAQVKYWAGRFRVEE